MKPQRRQRLEGSDPFVFVQKYPSKCSKRIGTRGITDFCEKVFYNLRFIGMSFFFEGTLIIDTQGRDMNISLQNAMKSLKKQNV